MIMYQMVGSHHQVNIESSWLLVLGVLLIWASIWKFIALWKAGRNNQLAWFIVMAVVNTAGLLEIAYLLFFQDKAKKRR